MRDAIFHFIDEYYEEFPESGAFEVIQRVNELFGIAADDITVAYALYKEEA